MPRSPLAVPLSVRDTSEMLNGSDIDLKANFNSHLNWTAVTYTNDMKRIPCHSCKTNTFKKDNELENGILKITSNTFPVKLAGTFFFFILVFIFFIFFCK